MHTHTIGVERLTADLARRTFTAGTLAVVERYDGDLVKVCATDNDIERDANRRGIPVGEYMQGVARNYARAYGADLV